MYQKRVNCETWMEIRHAISQDCLHFKVYARTEQRVWYPVDIELDDPGSGLASTRSSDSLEDPREFRFIYRALGFEPETGANALVTTRELLPKTWLLMQHIASGDRLYLKASSRDQFGRAVIPRIVLKDPVAGIYRFRSLTRDFHEYRHKHAPASHGLPGRAVRPVAPETARPGGAGLRPDRSDCPISRVRRSRAGEQPPGGRIDLPGDQGFPLPGGAE